MTENEILLTQVIQNVTDQIQAQRVDIGELFKGQKAIELQLAKLPCKDEFKRLKDVEDYIESVKKSESAEHLEKVKGGLSMIQAVIVALIAATPALLMFIWNIAKGGP